MSTDTNGIPDSGSSLLDHVSQFRLNLAQAQTPAGQSADAEWWSVLLILKNTTINDFAKAVPISDHQDLLIPVAYEKEDRAATPLVQPVTVFARKPLIDKMKRHDNPFGISMVYTGIRTPEETLDFNAKLTVPNHRNLAPDTVVMAVIDEGIAIGHDLFRTGSTTSRVAHATILDGKPLANSTSSIGRALDTKAVNEKLAECTFGGLLDEDRLYAELGLVNWKSDGVSSVARRASHGTHVATMAAGEEMKKQCNNKPLICVSLPTKAIEDTTGRNLLPLLALSLQILVKQAQSFWLADGSRAPVIFNLSFGNAGGPHDGTGIFAMIFEYYFGKYSASSDESAQKRWLTLPAGNLNLNRMHAVAHGPDPTNLNLKVLPNDRTPSFVQMWLPKSVTSDSKASITVTSPSGRTMEIQSTPGSEKTLKDDDAIEENKLEGKEYAKLACKYDLTPTGRLQVSLSLAPTAKLSGDGPIAPFGIWQIKITPRDDFDGTVEVWVRRDETLPGTHSGGRQAVFEDHNYIRFDRSGVPLAVDPPDTDCPIRRSYTISGFACGETPIVVAAFTEKEAEVSSYSGSGPTANRDARAVNTREGPDLTAKGDDSVVLRGVLSAGSRSGSWVRLSGTSMASPRVARAASEGIQGATSSARAWTAREVEQNPFHLRDCNPGRAGKGGVSIPVWCLPHKNF